MATGPTLQLQPMTSAPQLSIRGVKLSGVEPSRQLPSSSMVTWATTGILGFTSRAARIAWCSSSTIAKGFQHQQVNAAFDQGCDLLAEGGASFVEGGLAQRLDAHSQRSHRAGHPDVKALGRFLARLTPARLISRTRFSMLWRARRNEFPPKVLVSMISAPACKYS